MDNFILKTDSYKMSHWRQYPKGTETVYSYFESRGGKYEATVFFGLQHILKQHFVGVRVTRSMIDEAEIIAKAHFQSSSLFNRAGWEHILNDHGGKLPLHIKAPKEGSVISNHNVLMTVENTCPKCYWLTNYAETLLVQAWYPITVATQSREIKKIINRWMQYNGDPTGIDYKLHDFGFRGVSSVESAGIGGAAHLVNFKGTDTLPALLVAMQSYGAQPNVGLSIPAAEHSTITSWMQEHEVDAYRNMLEQYPSGLVAVVSDSYDIRNACSNIWGMLLKGAVMSRPGCLVVRPDSGHPPTIVLEVVKALDAAFGSTMNSKGYKVLDPHVRVIQGDGVNADSIDEILLALSYNKYSADNIAFGMGGALLQRLDRDTQKFAFKCSSITVNGIERDVFKAPATDLGKRSKAGRLVLVNDSRTGFADYKTMRVDPMNQDQLETVFLDGDLKRDQTFEEIRSLAR